MKGDRGNVEQIAKERGREDRGKSKWGEDRGWVRELKDVIKDSLAAIAETKAHNPNR